MPVTLSSNSGEKRVVFSFSSASEYAAEQGFESSISIYGQHYDGDHDFPFSVSVEGVWLRTGALIELRNHILQWASLPLEKLNAENLNGEFELACLPGQSINICFGPRKDTVTGLNPVVSVSFAAGSLQGGIHYITDQSCLAIFAQELSAHLGGQGTA